MAGHGATDRRIFRQWEAELSGFSALARRTHFSQQGCEGLNRRLCHFHESQNVRRVAYINLDEIVEVQNCL